MAAIICDEEDGFTRDEFTTLEGVTETYSKKYPCGLITHPKTGEVIRMSDVPATADTPAVPGFITRLCLQKMKVGDRYYWWFKDKYFRSVKIAPCKYVFQEVVVTGQF